MAASQVLSWAAQRRQHSAGRNRGIDTAAANILPANDYSPEMGRLGQLELSSLFNGVADPEFIARKFLT